MSTGDITERTRAWGCAAGGRTAYRVFKDPAVYEAEQERIFRGPVWSYVGLTAEVPEEGSYKTTYIGETPVILSRGSDGALYVLVNRCAHRGALVAREPFGCNRRYRCIYHQWGYDLDGSLLTVPYQRGQGGHGGYDEAFSLADHGLRRLRVETFHGLVFASFSESAPPLLEYLGRVGQRMLRVLEGRSLCVLGYLRQRVNANWKLYLENVPDVYHVSLLHHFANAFGFIHQDQRLEGLSDHHGVSLVTVWARGASSPTPPVGAPEGSGGAKRRLKLAVPEVVVPLPEHADDVVSFIATLPPGLVVHKIGNSMATRQLIPRGVDRFELVWTFVGYEDDPAPLRERRLLHNNLFGPSGYISLEDVEALEIVQRGIQGEQGEAELLELGGRDDSPDSPQRSMADEKMLRVFWRSWRRLMGE